MKEEYIKMRNSSQFDVGWFYRYYKDKGGNSDFNVFQVLFSLNEDMLKDLDKEFELTTLMDKDGKLIKVLY